MIAILALVWTLGPSNIVEHGLTADRWERWRYAEDGAEWHACREVGYTYSKRFGFKNKGPGYDYPPEWSDAGCFDIPKPSPAPRSEPLKRGEK